MNHQTYPTPNDFQRGDKVIHVADEEMIGTVQRVLPNGRCVVEFWIPGRKRGGYKTEIEFDTKELKPCYIDTETVSKTA